MKSIGRKKMGKIVRRVILAVLVIMALGIIWLSHDAPPPDDSALTVDRKEIPPEENAYTYFVLARESLNWTTNTAAVQSYLMGEHLDDAVLENLFMANSNTFSYIKQGIACEDMLTPTPSFLSLADSVDFLGLVRVIAAKVRFERLRGSYDIAIETCLDGLAFSSLVRKTPRSIVQFLIGGAMLDIANKQAKDLISDTNTPTLLLENLAEQLSSYKAKPEELIAAYKWDYWIVADYIDELKNSPSSLHENFYYSNLWREIMSRASRWGLFVKPNATKQLFATTYSEVIRDIEENPSEYHNILTEKYSVDNILKNRSIFNFNWFGEPLAAAIFAEPGQIINFLLRLQSDHGATRLMLACHLYKRAEGEFPRSLALLVPEYINEIPADPYDGKPFRYSFEKKALYSVGRDLIDSGGSTNVVPRNVPGREYYSRNEAEDRVYFLEK